MHAPDMLQYYLLKMNADKEVGMIDMLKLIRDNFDKEFRKLYIQ